jgi:hypothetical protein
VLHSFPKTFDVHAKIVVDQLVAHTGHLSPRHFWITCTERRRNVSSRFPNNLQGTNDRKHFFVVGLECLEFYTSNETLCLLLASRLPR